MKKSDEFLESKELKNEIKSSVSGSRYERSGLISIEDAKTYGKIVELETKIYFINNINNL